MNSSNEQTPRVPSYRLLLLPHSLSGFAHCFWVLLSITLQVPMSFSLSFVHLVWEWNCALCLLFAWLPFANVLWLWLILGTFCHLFHLHVNSLGTLQFHHALVPKMKFQRSRTSQKSVFFNPEGHIYQLYQDSLLQTSHICQWMLWWSKGTAFFFYPFGFMMLKHPWCQPYTSHQTNTFFLVQSGPP